SLRTPHSADGECHVLFAGRTALRLRAELCVLPGAAYALWHRHGRRMGHWCIAGHGKRACEVARRALWNSAERLLVGIPAGGHRLATRVADARVALDVLDRRPARAARTLY